MDDGKELIQKISNGDKKAFEQLFECYFEYLHNVAYNRLKSSDVADDIVQDIFVDIWANRKSLHIHTSVKSYLYQAVKNKVYKFIRYQSVREKEQYIRRIYDDFYEQNSYSKIHETVEASELKELVYLHLDKLPQKSQKIFYLSREDHFTHKEIAEKLNCSPKTVEYHIGKVLQHLRLHLKDYVVTTIPICFFLLF